MNKKRVGFQSLFPLPLSLPKMTPSSDGGDDLTAEHPTASRHRRLHNFSFLTLRWGAQRILRCKSSGTTHPQNPHPNPDGCSHPPAAVRSPWNLRTRRFTSSCNASPSSSPANGNNGRNRSGSANNSPSPEEAEEEAKGLNKTRFSVALSREEIEEDFMKIKGAKPQRRPKKRARIVQRKLDKLFPGLWLYEITTDSYKTND